MPRSQNISVQNNFTRGLITEATGLTFPENACTDTDNCVFSHFGKVSRRLGFDFEFNHDTLADEIEGDVIATYMWNNVAGEGALVFVVAQIGNTLYFYKVGSTDSLSAGRHTDTVDLTDFTPAGVTSVSNLECQFTSGNGILFVTNRRLDPFYVTYDIDTDTISTVEYQIKIRDLEGDSADPYGPDERPTATAGTLNAHHLYNLKNRGWTTANLTAWDTARTDMPSKADVPWYFKDETDAFDFTTVDDRYIGNSPAPGGHYIYDIYDVGRSTNSAGATNYAIALERFTTCSFFAGRVFYAGLSVENYSSRIWFTQIIERRDQIGNCYQTNDLASEKLFDLLPSDGGFIDILEAGTIFKMVNVLNALVVFSSNGVWAITGSQGVGFTANDYSVSRISKISNISHTSFVDVEGIPYWWNLEGIYRIALDNQSNSMRVESITDKTIRQFYINLPAESKQYARGVYDPFTKLVQWIYKSIPSASFNDKYVYDSALNLNLLSQAFYPWSFPVDDVKINSIVNVFGLSGVFDQTNVVRGADNVKNSGDQVIVFQSSNASTVSAVKYLTSFEDSGNQFTFSECYKDSYLDWEEFGIAEPYESFFITGYTIKGQAIRKFQLNYVNVFSENLMDSAFQISGMWNYGTSGESGRWSTAQVFTDFTQFKPKRIKIRGHGLTCQLRFMSYLNQPFNIIGWATFETANQWI